MGDTFRANLKDLLDTYKKDYCITGAGSLSCMFFTDVKVRDYETAKTSDTTKYGEYFGKMLNSGIYLAPAQFEAMFMSNAHTKEDMDKTLKAIEKAICDL